jgi:hypothetical protein
MLIMADRKRKCRAQTLIVPSCFLSLSQASGERDFRNQVMTSPYAVLVGPKSDYLNGEATGENQPRNGDDHDL